MKNCDAMTPGEVATWHADRAEQLNMEASLLLHNGHRDAAEVKSDEAGIHIRTAELLVEYINFVPTTRH